MRADTTSTRDGNSNQGTASRTGDFNNEFHLGFVKVAVFVQIKVLVEQLLTADKHEKASSDSEIAEKRRKCVQTAQIEQGQKWQENR